MANKEKNKKEVKIEFTPFHGEMEILSLDEAIDRVKKIMKSADIKKFEKEILAGTKMGYNDNIFKIRK